MKLQTKLLTATIVLIVVFSQGCHWLIGDPCIPVEKTTAMSVYPENDTINGLPDTINFTSNTSEIWLVFQTETVECQESNYKSIFDCDIKAISITSDTDYNQDYPAGSELTEIMTARYTNCSRYTTDYEIPVAEFLSLENICRWEIMLQFTKMPYEYRVHKFHIVFEEENGVVYETYRQYRIIYNQTK